ncbi:hypothetical protein SteCoe_9587 [Stentor coeruleus]|uniref:Tyrosine specific protein phosphatases domain-containing protein n=1 Tax=Stentor coeruleus TaxID=5963 RepID=A0A1R2CHE9_9CILI|nr:hypothetical protein SteCoe_9587 [Stentor coeruleus]
MKPQYKPHPLLNGSIIACERPSKPLLKILSRVCDLVITLQWETEIPEYIHDYCTEFNLEWLWVPIKAANYQLVSNDELFSRILNSLQQVKTQLDKGKRILVHCAAGVHRTGFFVYTLLRISGFFHQASLDFIRKIRPLILIKIGQHRIEIGQMFFDKVIGLTPKIPYFETLGFIETDFIKAQLFPLFWVKVLFCDNLVKISFCMTSCDFAKIVIGTEVYMKVEENFIWKDLRRFEKEGDVEIKSVEKCEEFIRDYVKSCTKDKKSKIAGTSCFFDKEFLYRFTPRVFDKLHYRIVDLASLDEIRGKEVKQTYSIYDDIRKYREYVNVFSKEKHK